MIIKSKRFKFRFNNDTCEFNSEFPQALAGAMDPQEFRAIFDKINGEMNQNLIKSNEKFQGSTKIFAISSIFVIGFFYSPVMQHYYRKRQKQAMLLWENIKDFLSLCNRRTFLKRRIEWRLVEDTKKMKGRDFVDPVLCYRIDIIQKFGKEKGPSTTNEEEAGQRGSLPISQSREGPSSSSQMRTQPQEPYMSQDVGQKPSTKSQEEPKAESAEESASEESSFLAMPLEQE